MPRDVKILFNGGNQPAADKSNYKESVLRDAVVREIMTEILIIFSGAPDIHRILAFPLCHPFFDIILRSSFFYCFAFFFSDQTVKYKLTPDTWRYTYILILYVAVGVTVTCDANFVRML